MPDHPGRKQIIRAPGAPLVDLVLAQGRSARRGDVVVADLVGAQGHLGQTARFVGYSWLVRKLGLLGGMSWESSILYERIINERVRDRLGGTASADLLIRSFNFAAIERLQEAGRWDEAGALLADAAANLEKGGAEAIVICTNTMHCLADQIGAAISAPILHIADATAASVRAAGLKTVGLLGTRYTMEQDFYAGRLRERHGLEVLIPEEPDRTAIHDVIYEELVRGVINPGSKARYLAAIERLRQRGAEGIIAGCTEIELLVGPAEVTIPYFPTTRLHAEAAAEFALTDSTNSTTGQRGAA